MMTQLVPGVAWPPFEFIKQPKVRSKPESEEKPRVRRKPVSADKPDSGKTRILAYLGGHPASTVTGTASALAVSYCTADMTLRRLTKEGLVRREQRKISNGIIYEYWRNDGHN